MKLPELLTIALVAILCGCSANKQIQTDHTVETVTVEHTVDTVFVDLPHENLQAVVPADSVSTLRTSTAVSTARLTTDGHIDHRLYTRDTIITIPVPTILTTRTEETDTRSRHALRQPLAPWLLILTAAILTFFILRHTR